MMRKLNILVADDDKAGQDFLKELLIGENREIFLAQDSFQAIEIALQNPIDLAFVDIRIAGLDGLKLYQRLKEINSGMACVFITAYDTLFEENLLEKTIDAQRALYLSKPFNDTSQIKKIISQALESITDKTQEPHSDIAKIFPDRRAYIRLDVTLEVDYKIKGEPGAFKRSLSKDIAPGGIKLFVQEELMPGTVLDLMIKVPGYRETCAAVGEVVWTKEIEGKTAYYATGIKFIEIDIVELSAVLIHKGWPKPIA